MAFSKLNYVNVGPGGTFEASGDVSSTPEDVDKLIEHLRSSGEGHVVVHLHGGLISESAGMDIAEKMMAPYIAAGAHPVSVVYETGFVRTLRDNLTSIHETQLFGKLLKYVRKYVAKKLGIDIGGLEAAGAEEPDLSRPAKQLESDEWFTALKEAAKAGGPEAAGGLEAAGADADQADQEEIEEWLEDDEEMRPILLDDAPRPIVDESKLDRPGEGPEGLIAWGKTAWTILKIGKRTLSRLYTDRDHGAYCTLVEEILREAFLADFGQWTWGAMKDKAHQMFQSNESRLGLGQYAGRYLMDGLATLQNGNENFTVDVVGHSLGTVAACELLDAMTGSLKVRHVAFLAPAVRTEVAHKAVITKPDRFSQFRVFTMTDQYEIDDELLGIIYPRSLLYFISGVLEDTEVDETILGMARHLTGAPPYDEPHLVDIVQFLKKDPTRVVWSVTDASAPEGQQSSSESHGGFDDDNTTRKSLTHYLKRPA